MLTSKLQFPSPRKDKDGKTRYKKANMSFAWSIPNILPVRLRRRLRSRLRAGASPASSLAHLNTSFSLHDTVRAVKHHRWTRWDLQYLLFFVLIAFSGYIIKNPGPLLKAFVGVAIVTGLSLPITRQIVLPLLPVITWLIFFYALGFVPTEWRPPIWVDALPTAERAIFGTSLSEVFSAHKSTAADILAWLPYGIIHFASPVITVIVMFIFGAPGSLPAFAKAYGYMNLMGVMIQFSFPCSPPWYEAQYGSKPAYYGMGGDPAGLGRIDKLFGVDMYTTTFKNQPVPFGAFPSLHSGWATTEALFMGYRFPRLRPLFWAYVMWIWWATMYLSHHYAVDLIGGSLLATAVYFTAKHYLLPRQQPGKTFRWDYDYVEVGNDDLGLDNFNKYTNEEDWTLGSTSSFSSGSRSPSDETQSIWEGETLASHSDSDSVEVRVR